MSCSKVEGSKFLVPGWACCSCKAKGGSSTYNGNQRGSCKACNHRRCDAEGYVEPLDVESYERATAELDELEVELQGGKEYEEAEGIAVVQRYVYLAGIVRDYEEANFPPEDGERRLLN